MGNETFDSIFIGLICLTGEPGEHWEYYQYDPETWGLKGYVYEKNGGSMPGPMARI